MVETAVKDRAAGQKSSVETAKPLFVDCLRLIERMHRRMLDVIKVELDQRGIGDINSVQALLIYNIGDQEVTAGELRSRGYYTGSNVSYNLKKLVETGYIEHQRAQHDRRAVRVRLSDKGLEICRLLNETFAGQTEEILSHQVLDEDGMAGALRTLKDLERFWADKIRFIEF